MSSNRISREAVNIRIASLISQRGTCQRLQVGAVFTYQNKIISTGYNGPPILEEHCNPFMCKTNEPCHRSIHAEVNAINGLPNYPTKYYQGELILYCTHQPCLSCSEQLVGIVEKVYFMSEYRDKAGIQLLLSKDIEVIKINLNGIKIPYEI